MKIMCPGCMHRCVLSEGQTGRCGARRCAGGTVTAINYGKLTAIALDPIEKKPLNAFHPGSNILSVGSFGCNLDCPFCQNAAIASAREGDLPVQKVSPDALADLALDLKPRGNIGVAFTYNEPLIGWEYVIDSARAVHARGLLTVAVTNGSVNPEISGRVLPHLDALNIDLKAFTADHYHRLGGDLDTVKTFITRAVHTGCHVELTTLIVPGFNDSAKEISALASWVAGVNPAIPLHITRFFPAHRMGRSAPTPVAKIFDLAAVARKDLPTVYEGNV